MTTFPTLESMISASAEAVRPAERLTVSQSAERFHYINLPGTHVGLFSNEKTPYMVEPQDELTSLDYTGMVFAGPARTGKSNAAINWLIHTASTDPADMMFVNMTQGTARDWSQGDLARMIRNNPEFKARMVPGRQNDNTFDKKFLSGMRLLIKWPTITELSGKTIPRLWLFDYDRMDQDIDGEGNPFDLARKRAQTFRKFGMCVAEASPGFEVENAKWMASSPHEAPPTKGILSLYNRGDRRRWLWECPSCHEPFEADFKHFHWPDSADVMDAAEQVTVVCPNQGCILSHDMKQEMNHGGRWVKEGQLWLPETNEIVGTARRSDIASFWLKGPAAAFTTWRDLVLKYLQACEEYELTGSEESLKTTTNVDLGLPYTRKAIEAGRLPETLKERAEDWGNDIDTPVVPEGVRFIVKTCDVQVRSFVIQTHGVTDTGDFVVIEMKKLRWSATRDHNNERLVIDPASRPEDWDVLIDELQQTYPLNDGSGRRMAVKIMGCDSGGADGVTANAYKFWRRLRDRGDASHSRFHLWKGASSKGAPRLSVSYPDAERKDRNAGARGDIPVQLINANAVKDQVDGMLGRTEPGGMVRFAKWSPDWFFNQLTTEIRTPNKGWENPSRKRNEAWDLLVAAVALCQHVTIRLELIDWSAPPSWAGVWDDNDLVSAPDAPSRLEDDRKPVVSMADLASQLG